MSESWSDQLFWSGSQKLPLPQKTADLRGSTAFCPSDFREFDPSNEQPVDQKNRIQALDLHQISWAGTSDRRFPHPWAVGIHGWVRNIATASSPSSSVSQWVV